MMYEIADSEDDASKEIVENNEANEQVPVEGTGPAP